MEDPDHPPTDAEFRAVMNGVRTVLRSVVIGAMAAWAAYIPTGLFLKAAIVGLAFFVVAGFASLRRWLEAPVVLLFVLATIHWCDDGRFSIMTKMANYIGMVH